MSSGEFQPLSEGDSSKDIEEDIEEGLREERGVQSPRVVLPRKKKNTYVCIVIFVILIAVTIAWTILSNNDGEETDQYSHLEARVGGAWPHTYNSRRARHHPYCGEDGIECCHIYGTMPRRDYTIDPIRIVKRDEIGSNCPSLSTIVHEYNEYYRKNIGEVNCSTTECCSVDISRDELIRHNVTVEDNVVFMPISKETHDVCPSITTMISAYEEYYNGDGDDVVFILLIIIILGVASSAKSM